MSRLLVLAAAASLVGICFGQSQNDQGSGSGSGNLSDRSPSANVRAAAVRERAPGNIVRDALARHRGLINDRITAARTGNRTTTGDNTTLDANNPTTTTATTGGSNLLGTLLGSGLLGQLGGGGNLTSVTDLLGTLGATTGPTTNNTGTTAGTTTNNPNIPPNVTPEVIALLQSFGIDINDVFPPPGGSSSRQQSRATENIDDLRAQQQQPPAGGGTSDQPKFITRLVDSLLSTVFNALVLGVQTQAFIDSIKNQLRSLFGLPAPASGALRIPRPYPTVRPTDRPGCGPFA